jgi:hypothetical protein
MRRHSNRPADDKRTLKLIAAGILLACALSVFAWRTWRASAPEKLDSTIEDRAAQIQANIQNASTGPAPDSTPVKPPSRIERSTTKHGPGPVPK